MFLGKHLGLVHQLADFDVFIKQQLCVLIELEPARLGELYLAHSFNFEKLCELCVNFSFVELNTFF